jgi:hypothetical protein
MKVVQALELKISVGCCVSHWWANPIDKGQVVLGLCRATHVQGHVGCLLRQDH